MSNVAPIILAQKYNPQMNPVLLGKSSFNFAVLTRNRNVFCTSCRLLFDKKNLQHHGPGPIANNWYYFSHMAVFTGHYL
jgi:hypothetical protein